MDLEYYPTDHPRRAKAWGEQAVWWLRHLEYTSAEGDRAQTIIKAAVHAAKCAGHSANIVLNDRDVV